MNAVFDPASYRPDRSLPAKVKRRLTQWRAVRRMPATPQQAIVSFTFDDFPKSAMDTGADLLDRIGAKGTYYTCTGMAGMTNLLGEMYRPDDLVQLASAGHEIAAHTHTHLDCARTENAVVQADIDDNLRVLSEHGHTNVKHFAWPYGETQFRAKKDIATKVQTARGILPGINATGSDLMQLRSFELTPDDWTHNRAKQAIETAARKGGWVTIFTHDVRDNPSPFGLTSAAFKSVIKAARDSGADILTMGAAYDRVMGAGTT